ncbi:CbtA family protein [Litoreibacter janthinus]|uniref:Cobalt transporter subunit CbtA n=1 Tax=Litoreibacter janthinus TaxID=670154 RepID=A0A1I6FTW6_9RHOB|nr:CbtA family protein [Litoreibacter janthinus]SFR33400.1 cobalt transporter subunit CbtA [Litoreibacter janthinus]
MFKTLLTSAIFAGVAVGLIAAVLQLWLVTPSLLEAELYESGSRIHFAVDGSTQSDAGAPSPLDDPARHLMTMAFNIIVFCAFALFIVVGYALTERAGHDVSPRSGLIWGLAGFIAVQLAPAIGMPPELPGTVAAEVELRQLWWISTVIATALGLGLIAFGPWMAGVAGAALIAVPHIVGAPHLDTYFGVAPPELSAHFVTASLGTSAVLWSLLGLFTAIFWTKFKDA